MILCLLFSDSNSSERSRQQLDLSGLLPVLFPRSP